MSSDGDLRCEGFQVAGVYSCLTKTRARIPKCRDPKDEMFLRVAYAAKVDAIVTADDDLLVLVGESRIPILHRASWRRALKSDGVAGIDP